MGIVQRTRAAAIEPAERRDPLVRMAVLSTTASRIPILIAASLSSAAVVTLVLWEYSSRRTLLFWLAFTLACGAVISFVAVSRHKNASFVTASTLRRQLLFGCVIPFAVPWGLLGPASNATGNQGVALCVVLVSAAAVVGAVAVGGAFSSALIVCGTFILLPNLVFFSLRDGITAVPTATLVYAALITGVVGRLSRSRLLDREVLSVRSSHLVDAVQEERANLAALNAELTFRATHDQLMGIPNRELFEAELEHAVSSARQEDARVGLLFLDLDRFKFVNDTLGHAAGDELLKAIGDRIENVLRADEAMVARVGGDELVVLQYRVSRPDELHYLAQRLITAVNDSFVIDGVSISIGVSIGMVVSWIGDTADDLYRLADAALYEAKEQGRNCVVLADDQLRSQRQVRISTELALRSALMNNEIEAWYQPEVNLITGEIVAAEALARWKTDEGVAVASSFIGVARRAGLLEQLMLRIADDVWDWRTEGVGNLPIGINVSAAHLRSLLARHEAGRRDRSFLGMRLEIAETDIIRDFNGARRLLERVRELGAVVLLDDFGTGYSSLRMLSDLPIDGIKIDRSYVARAVVDRRVRSLVTSLAEFGRDSGMLVVAEGVETTQQAEFLVDVGIERAQGFLFAPALERRDFVDLQAKGLMSVELAGRF